MTRYGKGSALLVVLGLMAFLSISALAFAAYMRYSRVPSSYTRRTAAARDLVKAALARAIDAVDKAVNDNPHPNLNGPAGSNGEDNLWKDRVFIGAGGKTLVPESDTVSPLSLEALAYIPPYLVNTVRWYSRRSPTAMWKTLDYDTGRYAYCAIDISDYLDVNRLFADAPRSSAPHTRFSLSYLFDDDGSGNYRNPVHTGPGEGTGTWDSWMENFRKVDRKTLDIDFKSEVPFVSIADFNMALGKRGRIPPFLSPFCEFVGENKLNAFDNTSYAEDGNTYADLRRMTFATDGLFPRYQTIPGHPDVKAQDLTDEKNQPFKMDYLESKDPSLSDSVLGAKLQNAFKNSANGHDRLSGLGCAALRDYLDTDHIPLSLAVPTTERVPMICGIETTFALDNASVFSLETEPDGVLDGTGAGPTVVSEDGESGNRTVEIVLNFRFSPQFAAAVGAGNIDVLTVFPFSHADESDTPQFGLDGRLSFFLAEGNVPLRPVGPPTQGSQVYGPHLDERNIPPTSLDSGSGIVNVKLECSDKIKVNDLEYPLDGEASAVKQNRISMPDAQAALGASFAMTGNEILGVTLRWNQRKNENGVWSPSASEVVANIARGETEYLSGLRSAHCAVPAIKWGANGQCEGADEKMSSPGRLRDMLAGGEPIRVSLKGAVWLRVLDSKENKVVDMVPACFEDDRIHLGGGASEPGMKDVADSYLGRAYPLMLLETGYEFDFSLKGLLEACGSKSGFRLSPQTAYVSDPRYNHAPEHWFKAAGDMSKEGWLKENRSWLGGRNGDIFMATSDSGYMQSKYELMFIPRFTNLKGGGDVAGCYEAPSRLRYSIPETFEDTLNKSLVWKTYCPFPNVFPTDYLAGDSDDFAAFDALPWTNDGSNFKMTPFSDNLNAFSGVFANTPIDWKRASTNEVDGAPYYFGFKAKDFNSKYAYNEWTSETRLAWDDVKSFATRYMGLVRREGELRGNWKQAWQDMDWFGEDKDGKRTLCDVELTENGRFWSADRKFLYGFWRDCIEPKQQLYLIFVRAEPMMIGVGDLRKMPPQLGARAVGLVWRDPAATGVNNGYPHRTRILFYRQFE